MKVEYVAACEATKEPVWLFMFLIDLEVITSVKDTMTLYCDNSGAATHSKEP